MIDFYGRLLPGNGCPELALSNRSLIHLSKAREVYTFPNAIYTKLILELRPTQEKPSGVSQGPARANWFE